MIDTIVKGSCVKSYRQYCPVAKGLDLIGERWTLLVVRELLALGALRFSDLAAGIPGIPPAQLSDRLRSLEERGIVRRDGAEYALTEWGHGLEPVLAALGSWAAPALADAPDDDRFQAHWLVVPLRAHLADGDPTATPVRIAIDTEGERLVVTVAGSVSVGLDDGRPVDATLSGDRGEVLRVIAGVVSPGEPGAAVVTGDTGAFSRLARARSPHAPR